MSVPHPSPGVALLRGDWREALEHFALEHVLERRRLLIYYQSVSSLIGAGAALRLLGDQTGAVRLWLQISEGVKKNQFTHSHMACFQAPLLLWFGAARHANEDLVTQATVHLEKLLSKKATQTIWPASLAKHLLLGESIPQVSKEVSLFQRRQTQACFYAGVSALRLHGILAALSLWKQSPAKDSQFNELEHYILSSEIHSQS
jgi:hypothetical protein